VTARHLPGFFRCPHCSGYFHEEGSPPPYEEGYFAAASQPSLLSKGLGKVLEIFLWTRKRCVKRTVGANKSAEILDYGCGNGKLVRYLRQHGFKVDGFDPSAAAVALARQADLPVFSDIPHKKYDLIMFWHSLEHTDTPLSDLGGLLKHLKPDGQLLIAVPNGDSLEAYLTRGRWFCYDWPFHRVHFTPRALRGLLEQVGCKVQWFDFVNMEYTISSLMQSFLNTILPKNTLYSVVSNRRMPGAGTKIVFFGLLSLGLLTIFSPLILFFFLIALVSRRTAAMIVVAKSRSPNHLIT